MQIGECAANNKAMGSWKAAAFMSNPDPKFAGGDITKRECKYAFYGPMFQGIPDTEKKNKMKGYSLTYTSEKACEGDKKFQYKMNILCNKGGVEQASDRKFVMGSSDACSAEMNFVG